jgi:hypothetical protein
MSDEWGDDRRRDVLTLNTDEVRRVVRDENKGLTAGIQGLMIATEKMTDAVQGLVADSRVNEEKFANINAQILHNGNEAEEINRAVFQITTVVIPDLEKQVALNGFSLLAFWKTFALVFTPVAGMAAYLFKEIEGRDAHILVLMADLHKLITAL